MTSAIFVLTPLSVPTPFPELFYIIVFAPYALIAWNFTKNIIEN